MRGREELAAALVEAARHDRKLVIEKAIEGREVECAILGNEEPRRRRSARSATSATSTTTRRSTSTRRREIIAPADLPADIVERVQELALQAFNAIDGAGMSRVDFFLLPDGSLIIDEINTIPGFTPAQHVSETLASSRSKL